MIDKYNDWRLMGQEKYLLDKDLMYKSYRGKINEHEHCEFCMIKFGDNEEDLHEGYCTLDMYYWICKDCFNDFKEMFHWNIVSR